jgi:hypothetical protein
MEKQTEIGEIGIGRKENIALKPEIVKIVSFKVEMQKNKDGKEIGDKVIIVCKHSEREDLIEISSVSYRKGKEIKTTGIWFKLDSDNLIPKQSALASVLNFLNVSNLNSIVDKEIPTELDENNYLCFKCY